MAAARRSSDSGVVVALVVFVILAFAGVGCGIWFYQQAALARQAIAANQEAVKSNIGAVFTQNNWDLPTQTTTDLGVSYNPQTFEKVAQKLKLAARYEKDVLPTLGWKSLGGIEDALAASPLQKKLEAEGEATFEQVSGLLEAYERRYESLTEQVAELTDKTEDLSANLQEAQQDLVAAQEEFGQKLNQQSEDFKNQLANLREDYEQLLADYENQQEKTVAVQQKLQNAIDQRKEQVARLERELKRWENRYWEEVRGPQREDQLEPTGKVVRVDPENDFVFVEGGQDVGFRENEVYVVFGRTPDGQERKKGVITIAEVGDTVSRATVTSEKEFIVKGDYFVSFELWDKFHGS